ncbi:MarR family winged helix-turn-helix transcriptional regulator [Amycolatopsis taiwanensis]|uniref:MarR family winged helix-turn-helix transcriptional regulator n=1 Tax=Amycolatopsis taiwanensis TaxID=342230 RepID=UPI001FE0032F|nr:MarR family winged helix-turn-helix transcriptional regulator [Amycolatopsis taiwanensis]
MNDEAVTSPPQQLARESDSNAFLLAQLGAHAAQRFAERIVKLDLTPPQAGLLRIVAAQPGQSQQMIAGQLGTPASRVVALVDGLQERGLVERRRNPEDRRNYALHLTGKGRQLLRRLGRLARQHDEAICAGLTEGEREQLHGLLARLAAAQGLPARVHPGYRAIAD